MKVDSSIAAADVAIDQAGDGAGDRPADRPRQPPHDAHRRDPGEGDEATTASGESPPVRAAAGLRR